eukprot:GHVU01154863.1.p1 GENE.GHVU01154863.1~~GHVU01154863.1.p1  ORF type:complete len:226 (+),score=2.29 GHVU01154863.1:162-839(+)
MDVRATKTGGQHYECLIFDKFICFIRRGAPASPPSLSPSPSGVIDLPHGINEDNCAITISASDVSRVHDSSSLSYELVRDTTCFDALTPLRRTTCFGLAGIVPGDPASVVSGLWLRRKRATKRSKRRRKTTRGWIETASPKCGASTTSTSPCRHCREFQPPRRLVEDQGPPLVLQGSAHDAQTLSHTHTHTYIYIHGYTYAHTGASACAGEQARLTSPRLRRKYG